MIEGYLSFSLRLPKNHEEEVEGAEEHMLSGSRLRPEMVLSRDCINKDGLLLLRKGTELSEAIIDKVITFEKIYNTPLQVYVRI